MAIITLRDDFDNAGGSAVNLSAWTPSDPGSSGWTAWQYTGSASDVLVETFDATKRHAGGTYGLGGPCRLNIDFVEDHFEMTVDVERQAVDVTTEAGVCFWVKNTTIGSFTDTEYYKVVFQSLGADTCQVTIVHVNSSGTRVDEVTSSPFTMWYAGGGTPDRKRLRIQVHGTVCTAYISDSGTGASESLVLTHTLLTDYRGSDHLRHGIVQSGSASGQMIIKEFILTDLVGTDAGITDPSSLVGTIATGRVLRVERADGEIEEWVVANSTDDVDNDRTSIVALPVDAWLAERVQVRSNDTLSVAYDGALDTVLDALLATDEVPSWLIAGTVSVTPRISGTWSKLNITAAIRQMVSDANNAPEVVLARDVVRSQLRRVSNTQWAVDLLTAAASGVPALVEGKQITRFTQKVDRTREAQVIYPINTTDTTVAYAFFRVSVVTADITLTLTDWSTGPDQLAVVEDDQWVGHYIVAPDGTTYAITASSAADQTVTCSSLTAGDINVDDLVRFAIDSGGTPNLAVTLPDRLNPKKATVSAPWPTATNWALNSQMRTLDGGDAEPEGWTAAAGAEDSLTAETGATYVETGSQSLKWVIAGASETLTMDAVLVPEERFVGSTFWFGVKFYATSSSLASIQFYKGGAGTGSLAWTGANESTITDGNWHIQYGWNVFASGNTTLQLRMLSAIAGTIYIDRFWIYLDGEEDDNTVEGCGPTRGLYYGNFELELRGSSGLAYEVGITDSYRQDPVTFVDDKLRVNQQARLVYPSRDVDTSVPIASLEVNELKPYDAKVTVGAIRRRLTDLV